MKKPVAVYFLSMVYGCAAFIAGGFLVAGLVHALSFFPAVEKFWKFLYGSLDFQLLVGLVSSLFLVLAYGLWQGKPWARNLCLVVNLFFTVNLLMALLPNFTVLKLEDLTGWPRAVAYIQLMLLVSFLGLFLISLKPEVGRFCKVYPEEKLKA
jgi:hypothetical protein